MRFINLSSIAHRAVSINFKEFHNPNGSILYYYDCDHVILGYSGKHAAIEDIASFVKNYPIFHPRQVHGASILDSNIFTANMTGDGLLLRETGVGAVIQTADCTPLFFWHAEKLVGGILHIGWRGLQQGIEVELARRFKSFSELWPQLLFYLGPSIAAPCYEVGRDVFDSFSLSTYRAMIFKPVPGKDTFLLDIPAGISLSLQSLGIPPQQIIHSGICTRCDPRQFPSYRRDGPTGTRIYSFLLFKRNKESWYE